jgi:hypothetical protein
MKMDTFVDALAWIDYLIDEVREFDGPVLDAVTADPVSLASMSLCVNMQRASSAKYVCLLQLVQHFKSVIVWLMEAYVDLLSVAVCFLSFKRCLPLRSVVAPTLLSGQICH